MGVVLTPLARRAPRHDSAAASMIAATLLLGLVAAVTSSPAPGHFYGYHGYHAPCTTELETVTKKLCRIEVERECETMTKTFCKKTPVTEEVSKDFELCRPKPSEVCEDKEIMVPKLVCGEVKEADAE